MQLRRNRRTLLAVAVFAVCLPRAADAQIGKVNGRNGECVSECGSCGVFPNLDFIHAFCKKPICPTCKTRYCPLDAMPNYGYSAPRWSPFPGTTPSYTPKKKDIGISSPPPAPPSTTGGPTGGTTRLPTTPPESTASPAAMKETSRQKDYPSFPIAPGAKASVGPDIKPIDVEDPR